MTNSKPWQTILTPQNANKVISTENNLSAIKQSNGSSKKSIGFAVKEVAMPRRYSFDDNGGSYLGL